MEERVEKRAKEVYQALVENFNREIARGPRERYATRGADLGGLTDKEIGKVVEQLIEELSGTDYYLDRCDRDYVTICLTHVSREV